MPKYLKLQEKNGVHNEQTPMISRLPNDFCKLIEVRWSEVHVTLGCLQIRVSCERLDLGYTYVFHSETGETGVPECMDHHVIQPCPLTGSTE